MKIVFKQIEAGSERVIEKFLLFPKIIGYELRWLEVAKIKQVYYEETEGRNGWCSESFEN